MLFIQICWTVGCRLPTSQLHSKPNRANAICIKYREIFRSLFFISRSRICILTFNIHYTYYGIVLCVCVCVDGNKPQCQHLDTPLSVSLSFKYWILQYLNAHWKYNVLCISARRHRICSHFKSKLIYIINVPVVNEIEFLFICI